MSEVRIAAEPRNEFGKGGARRTRRAGKVPAVLYGHGTDPRHIALPAREFAHAIKGDAGLNVLLTLDIAGEAQLALPKSVQRHPIKGDIEHVDLLVIERGERVRVDVAVHVVGETPRGGLLEHTSETVSVEADATQLPDAIEVDVTSLEIGQSVHAGDLALPAGATLADDAEKVVIHVLPAPTAAQLEADLGGGGEEAPTGDVVSDEA